MIRPWPVCCGYPQFLTPQGWRCAVRCEEAGLFPEPARSEPVTWTPPEFVPGTVTVTTAGDLL